MSANVLAANRMHAANTIVLINDFIRMTGAKFIIHPVNSQQKKYKTKFGYELFFLAARGSMR
jgi:hypothetical protein